MAQKILIVDDEPELVTAFTRMLAHEAYEVERAASGEAALELIDRGGIELVLLDVCMPSMSGLDVLARLRERNSSVPTIVISGAGSVDVAVQAIKLGAKRSKKL